VVLNRGEPGNRSTDDTVPARFIAGMRSTMTNTVRRSRACSPRIQPPSPDSIVLDAWATGHHRWSELWATGLVDEATANASADEAWRDGEEWAPRYCGHALWNTVWNTASNGCRRTA